MSVRSNRDLKVSEFFVAWFDACRISTTSGQKRSMNMLVIY